MPVNRSTSLALAMSMIFADRNILNAPVPATLPTSPGEPKSLEVKDLQGLQESDQDLYA